VGYQVFYDYTCERALIFYGHYLLPLWNAYLDKIREDAAKAKDTFPLLGYIANLLQVEASTLFSEGCDV